MSKFEKFIKNNSRDIICTLLLLIFSFFRWYYSASGVGSAWKMHVNIFIVTVPAWSVVVFAFFSLLCRYLDSLSVLKFKHTVLFIYFYQLILMAVAIITSLNLYATGLYLSFLIVVYQSAVYILKMKKPNQPDAKQAE
jgi:hypothetical protein